MASKRMFHENLECRDARNSSLRPMPAPCDTQPVGTTTPRADVSNRMLGRLAESIRELSDYRDLLRELIGREMKVRYRRSALGFLWSLITPLYQIVIYTFVFKYIMHVQGKNLSVSILVGLIPWTFFSVGVLNSCSAVMRYRNVVKKVYFPRQMLVLATVASNLVHLLLSMGVLLIVFLAVPIHVNALVWFLIPLVILQTLLVSGLGLISCVAHTFYGDVEYILTNLMQVAMFASPVVYSLVDLTPQGRVVEKIATWPEAAQILYKLNPMTIFTQGWRDILLPLENYPPHYPDPMWLAIAAGVSVAVFVIGLLVWQRYEWRFPEVI